MEWIRSSRLRFVLALLPLWLILLLSLLFGGIGEWLLQQYPDIQQYLIFKAFVVVIVGNLIYYTFSIGTTLGVDAVILSFLGICISYVPKLRSRAVYMLLALIVGFVWPVLSICYSDYSSFHDPNVVVMTTWPEIFASIIPRYLFVAALLAAISYFFAPYNLEDSTKP